MNDVSSVIASGVCVIWCAAKRPRTSTATRLSAGALTKTHTKNSETSDPAYRARARELGMTDARAIWITIFCLECATVDARSCAR